LSFIPPSSVTHILTPPLSLSLSPLYTLYYCFHSISSLPLSIFGSDLKVM
jgi:hypothetical protein